MNNSLNVLILSCGTRNKIVQYFKKELRGKGKIFAADCSELAPALYEADKYFIVPRTDEDGYIDVILEICKKNNIKAVLSLIDPELSLLAQHKDDFLKIGTTPVISDYEAIKMSFDKYEFYKYLNKNDIKTIKSYVDKDLFFKDIEAGKISYPVFVKPVTGSASININKVFSKEEIDLLFESHKNLMIQEFMDGVEYGVDVYVDMFSKELVNIFVKEKLKMRSGETDKSVSVVDKTLFDLIKEFIGKTSFSGVLDIDIFKKDGVYYISEVNPRFGGGYPHAYECGVNIPKMIVNNLLGFKNNNECGSYDSNVYMMKFNEVMIVK